MSESLIKSQNKITEKNKRKFHGVLRRLIKSDSSVNNKMKVTVYKVDNTEKKKQLIIAPLIFTNYCRHLINHNSTINTNVNIIENLIKEEENSSPVDSELKNYPDSSDFDDDDE